MPYVSKKQRGKFHVLEAQGKISPKIVSEFDKASKGLKLPERVVHKAKTPLPAVRGGSPADYPFARASSLTRN